MILQQAAASPPGRQTSRLFFALWPGAALRKRIAAHQALWTWSPPARPTPASKLHLTLLFMDGVDPARTPDLLRIGADAARGWADFCLTLDRAAVWRSGGIAHLVPQRPPASLLALHRTLAEHVALRDVPFDARPYSPHLTLGRRAERLAAPSDFAPVHWPVRGFVLVQSVLGTGRYAVLGRWPVG